MASSTGKAGAGEAVERRHPAVAPVIDGAGLHVLDQRAPFAQLGIGVDRLAEGLHLDRLAGPGGPLGHLRGAGRAVGGKIDVHDDLFAVLVDFQPFLEFGIGDGRNLRRIPAGFEAGFFVSLQGVAFGVLEHALALGAGGQAERAAHVADIGELHHADIVETALDLPPAARAPRRAAGSAPRSGGW